MKIPRYLDFLLSMIFVAILLCPELAHARTWWWALMKGAQEGAKRCGQVAIMAENQYRAEVAS